MSRGLLTSDFTGYCRKIIRRFFDFLAPRPYTAIMFAALFTTLAAKLFHSYRSSMGQYSFASLAEYLNWICADIAVLLTIEIILAAICFNWPKRFIIRSATIFAAKVCTWSVINAAWLIRTGTQILPSLLLPLLRAPLNSLAIVGVNLAKMPLAATILLLPSAIALTFYFAVLINPRQPGYIKNRFTKRILITLTLILTALLAQGWAANQRSIPIGTANLQYNSQLKAVTCLLSPKQGYNTRQMFAQAKRIIPNSDSVNLNPTPNTNSFKYNVVIIVLEGVQYKQTSLYDKKIETTTYLETIAARGAEFTNMRSTLTHTTKALFSLLTGRYPSAYHDLAEAVPISKPYASLATILRDKLNYRTAFFQSAKGNFECRPGLVHNLGFDEFYARRDIAEPNTFIGYLACDEYSLIKPVTKWIAGADAPFLLTILCSVTHDPYVVPEWFAPPAKEPLDRYRQTIKYTDAFIKELDTNLAKMGLRDNTILCVIGDHGEAFGEHGQLGHEQIAYDEVLRVPWIIRAPYLIKPATRINSPVSSIDLPPTILAMLGIDIDTLAFDGKNSLAPLPPDRKVFFSGWMHMGPAGFIQRKTKYLYNPTTNQLRAYDLANDARELNELELPEEETNKIIKQIAAWRKNTIFQLPQAHTGKTLLFKNWLCQWTGRIPKAKYQTKTTKDKLAKTLPPKP